MGKLTVSGRGVRVGLSEKAAFGQTLERGEKGLCTDLGEEHSR